MKKATQPNGISFTPGNCSRASRSRPERSLTVDCVIRRPVLPAGDRGTRAEVERLDPEEAAVGPARERGLVDVERHQRHPAEPVGPADDDRRRRRGAEDLRRAGPCSPPAGRWSIPCSPTASWFVAPANDSIVRTSLIGIVPTGVAGRIGPSTLSRAACQLAPTVTTRCPPCPTHCLSASPWTASAPSAGSLVSTTTAS